jgi:hypothetical protein
MRFVVIHTSPQFFLSSPSLARFFCHFLQKKLCLPWWRIFRIWKRLSRVEIKGQKGTFLARFGLWRSFVKNLKLWGQTEKNYKEKDSSLYLYMQSLEYFGWLEVSLPFLVDFCQNAISQISSHCLKDFPLLRQNLSSTFKNELFSGLKLTNMGEKLFCKEGKYAVVL